MYPVARMAKEVFLNRKRGPLSQGETHVAYVMVWPWDIDTFLELNNGRILTFMDLGRMGFFVRMGVLKVLKERGWYGTVAGSVIRYRRRITVFQRLELRTRIVGWDKRFVYFDQALWRGNDCCAHAVIRTAITTGKGIVPTEEVVAAMGFSPTSPALPEWVAAWSTAEGDRPWPPDR